MRLLHDAGYQRVFVGGSFVTAKSEPNDVDVAWDTGRVDADSLAPIFFDFEDERAAQKRRFGAAFSRRNFLKGSRVNRFSVTGVSEVLLSREGYPTRRLSGP